MSLLKPKFVLLAALCALLPMTLMSACGGPAFSGTQGEGGSGGAVVGSGGQGIGAGTGTACDGPEDCDDKDACTVDRCNADGTCDAAPKCLGTEKCCDGLCAECCAAADCDDGVSCTDDLCFAEQCMFVPDHSQCAANQYCSVKDSCRAKQVCDSAAPVDDPAGHCEDESGCTVDTCVDNFCDYHYCDDSTGTVCCEDTRCAQECCNDSGCDDFDDNQDPCKVGSCTDGICSLIPLCQEPQLCCPSADGTTATCGMCCSAGECNDLVDCTVDKCTGGTCSNNPDSSECPNGYICDPTEDCQQAVDCLTNAECVSPNPCQTGRCEAGTCRVEGCATGQNCCASGCAACCNDMGCDDSIPCTNDTCGPSGCSHSPGLCPTGQTCSPTHGGCIECTRDETCADANDCDTDICDQQTHKCTHMPACADGQVCNGGQCADCKFDTDCSAMMMQLAPPVIGNPCTYYVCLQGTCQPRTEDCGEFLQCCPGGCSLQLCF